MPTPHGLEHGLQGPCEDHVQSTAEWEEENHVSQGKSARVRRGRKMGEKIWVGVKIFLAENEWTKKIRFD